MADELLGQRAISEPTWRSVRANLADRVRATLTREVIELCLLIGHYQGLASAIGGPAIEPEITQNG